MSGSDHAAPANQQPIERPIQRRDGTHHGDIIAVLGRNAQGTL
jgi:hypothetical protein